MASHDDNSNGDSQSNLNKEEHGSLAEAFEWLSTTPSPRCEREEVTIHVTFHITGKTFQLHLDPSTTVDTAYTQILNHPEAKESVGRYPTMCNPNYTFLHEGKEWPNYVNGFSYKLEHFQMKPNFHLVVLVPRKIYLKVDSEGPFSKYFPANEEEETDGQNIEPPISNLTCHINMVDVADTVAQLQILIRQQLAIPPSEGFFLQTSTGIVLPDPNAHLYTIELPHRSQYFTLVPYALSLQTLDGKKAWLGFARETTLRQFKCEVKRLTGIPLHRQSLLVEDEGQELTPSLSQTKTMAEAGITSNLKLFVLDVARNHVLSSPTENSTTSGCSIPKTEYRALPLWELKRAARELILRCKTEAWTSTDPKRKGQLLQPQDVTLYDFVHHYLEPITLARRCSYAELVLAKSVAPQWFVSHWWGAPFLHFLGCLEQHAHDNWRSGWTNDPLEYAGTPDGTDPDDTTYWICAFSNNQHQINTEGLGGDPSQTSFYRAMQLAEGVVTVLDDEMTAFSRVWCAYEIYMALCGFEAQGASKSYEIYTANSNHIRENALDTSSEKIRYKYPRPFVGVVDRMEAHNIKLGPSNFPSLRKALDVRVETGEASFEDDRRRILNSICGNITNDGAPPPVAHEAYDKVNAMLRGKIAWATYRSALEQGEDMEKYRRAIAQYPNLREARAEIRNCLPFLDEAKHFMVHLPTCLVSLDLNYSRNRLFVDSSDFCVGLSRLQNLTRLSLELGCSYRLQSIDTLCLELSSMANLQDLEMDFNNCTQLAGVGNAISKALGKLSKLHRLSLKFCTMSLSATDLVLMGETICTMLTLEECQLEMQAVHNLCQYDKMLMSSFFLKFSRPTSYFPNLKYLKLTVRSKLDCWSRLTIYRQVAQILNPTIRLTISFERYLNLREIKYSILQGWTGSVEALTNRLPVIEGLVKELNARGYP